METREINNNWFYQLVDSNEQLDQHSLLQLKEIIDKYPYFQLAIFIYLKSLYTNTATNNLFQTELNRLSINVNDRKALFYNILSDEYRSLLDHTGKIEIEESRTDVLLNAFFESHDKVANATENRDLAYNLAHGSLASSDYFYYIEHADRKKEDQTQESTTEMQHQSIIDTFIAKSEQEGGIKIQLDVHATDGEENANGETDQYANAHKGDAELDEEIFFTETLAKIYIKQNRYEKAYKIIKHLSLNYPKKNSYFADQLRFLEKLIINSKHKDKK